MTSREQFEAWCNSDPDRSITMEDSTRFFCAWEAWQASREAVEVELPPQVDCCNVPFAAHSWNACLEESEKRIRAAGIKVKGG